MAPAEFFGGLCISNKSITFASKLKNKLKNEESVFGGLCI